MTDLIITKTELKNYLDSLDSGSTDIKRILGGVQSLDPLISEQLFTYLVNGVISIEDLYSRQINNYSIKIYLDAINQNSSNPDNLVSLRKKIKSMDGYRAFENVNFINNNQRLGRLIRTPIEYFTKVVIDQYGINRSAKYKSVTEVQDKYTEIIATNQDVLIARGELTNAVTALSQVVDISQYNTFLLHKIEALFFVYTEDEAIKFSTSGRDFLGWILKDGFLDIFTKNLVKNFNSTTTWMYQYMSFDTTGTGSIPLIKVIDRSDMRWNSVFIRSRFNNDEEIISQLSEILFRRFTMPVMIYGASYIDPIKINTLQTEYNLLLDYMNKLKSYMMAVSTSVSEGM